MPSQKTLSFEFDSSLKISNGWFCVQFSNPIHSDIKPILGGRIYRWNRKRDCLLVKSSGSITSDVEYIHNLLLINDIYPLYFLADGFYHNTYQFDRKSQIFYDTRLCPQLFQNAPDELEFFKRGRMISNHVISNAKFYFIPSSRTMLDLSKPIPTNDIHAIISKQSGSNKNYASAGMLFITCIHGKTLILLQRKKSKKLKQSYWNIISGKSEPSDVDLIHTTFREFSEEAGRWNPPILLNTPRFLVFRKSGVEGESEDYVLIVVKISKELASSLNLEEANDGEEVDTSYTNTSLRSWLKASKGYKWFDLEFFLEIESNLKQESQSWEAFYGKLEREGLAMGPSLIPFSSTKAFEAISIILQIRDEIPCITNS